jgi:hypothetical protein
MLSVDSSQTVRELPPFPETLCMFTPLLCRPRKLRNKCIFIVDNLIMLHNENTKPKTYKLLNLEIDIKISTYFKVLLTQNLEDRSASVWDYLTNGVISNTKGKL